MIIYLLPPSEGKNTGGLDAISSRTFDMGLPLDIATSATEKDLKCQGKRYEEGMRLNRRLNPHPSPLPMGEGVCLDVLPGIQRYSGGMYKAIGYDTMSAYGKNFFDDHVLILSGMYGILKPQDMIANYKLPIDTKGLRAWRGEKVTDALIGYVKENGYGDSNPPRSPGAHSTPSTGGVSDGLSKPVIVDLLSGAYKKMLQPEKIREAGIEYIEVDFIKNDGTKYTHGVKKVKGEWLRGVCEEKMELEITSEIVDITV